MNLDKRIKALTDIQSVTDGCHDWEFMTKKGYFAESITEFEDLKKCVYAEYIGYREHERCFHYWDEKDGKDYTHYARYFIPEDSLLPVVKAEKKYRPYSLEEFISDVNLGEPWIRMRPVGTDKECKLLYTGYLRTDVGEYVCLGCHSFDFISLFENYEIEINGEWQPFGVLVKEKE